jgi:hypothetical protein
MKHFLILISVLATFAAQAQWSSDPAVNIPLTDTLISINNPSNARNPRAVTNGNGGAYIVWENGSRAIYGQLLNESGNKQWEQSGITVGHGGSTNSGAYTNPVIISDDHGGAILTWMESFKNGIGASKIRPGTNDTIVWDQLISFTSGQRANPVLATDGAGGAIITWEDTRNGSANIDIYAQRISDKGVLMWDANGIPVCTVSGDQTLPNIASDSMGGAFITWQDNRRTTKAIYAQRINPQGQRQWQADGMPVCVKGDPALAPRIAATAKGEAIITWQNGNSGGTWDIYAQKVNIDTISWALNGVSVCSAPLSQMNPVIVADGFGGAIVTWEDTRTSFSNPDIYAQSITSSGLVQWTPNGIPICTLPEIQATPAITSDGAGGAIIGWEDYRSGNYYDIYAQRVNHSGSAMWSNNGQAICIAPKDQRSVGITGNGKGGAIITWHDRRNNSGWVIYAQGVQADGTLGGTTSVSEKPMADGFSLDQNYPNPFNSSTIIRYKLPRFSFVTLTVYNTFGLQVAQLVNEHQQQGEHEVVFHSNQLAFGTYFYRLQAGDYVTTKKMILIP